MMNRSTSSRRSRRTSSILAMASASAALVGGLSVSSAFGANNTWDILPGGTVSPVTGDGTITDGSGTWDNSTANFTTNGGVTDFAWSNTTNASDTAVFGTVSNSTTATPYTVTLASGGISAGGVTFALTATSPNVLSSYTLTGGPLNLPAAGGAIAFNGTAGVTNTIGSVITGGPLTISSSNGGYNTLSLTNANTYTGGTSVTATGMILNVGNATALGIGDLTYSSNYDGLIASTAVTLANNVKINGTGTGGAGVQLGNSGSQLTLNGVVSGVGGVYKQSTSTLVLAGTNTYSGGTLFQGGTIRILSTSSAFGTGSILVNTSTTNGVVTDTIATQSGSSAVTVPNNITVTNNGTGTTSLGLDGGYGTITLNGVISGSGAVYKTSSGTIIFGNANSYSDGMTLNGGETGITTVGALGTGSVTVTTGVASTAGISSTNAPFLEIKNTGSFSLANNLNLPTTVSSTPVYTLTKDATSYTTGTNLLISGVLSGGTSGTTLELTSNTSSDYTTSFEISNASNTLAGTVALLRGYLILDNGTALGSAGLLVQSNVSTVAGAGNVVFNGTYSLANNIKIGTTAGNTFDVPGSNTATLNGVFSSPSVSGVEFVKQDTGTLVLTNTSNAFLSTGSITVTGGTLEIGGGAAATGVLGNIPVPVSSGATLAFNNSDSLTYSGSVSGAGNLTKTGTGTLILNTTNTYTGTTTVNGGTLTVATALNTPSSITINNGGTLAIAVGSAIGQSVGKSAITINDGVFTSVTNPTTGTNNAYAFFSNALTMTGGTLSAGTSIYSNVYGFNSTGSIVATSDAAGNPATISAETSLAPALPVTVNRGTALPAVDLLISGKLIDGSSASGIAKSGNGILQLTGINTYSAGTTIIAGVLQANSSATALGIGSTTISGTGVLAGTGFTGSGAISVGTATGGAGGGTITAGTGGTPNDLIGTLTSTGSQAWNDTGTYAAKINGTTSDELIMTGLTTASSSFTISVTGTTGSTFTVGHTYVIADATASTTAFGALNGPANFVLTTTGTAAGDSFALTTSSDGGGTGSGEYLDLTVNSTPEPGSLSLSLMGIGGLLLKRRRRSSGIDASGK